MVKKKRRGKSVRKQRNQAAEQTELANSDQQTNRIPHSFVLHRGTVGKYVQRLVSDVRKVMEPNTASNLKARQQNSLRDFTSVAGPLGVSHMIVMTRSDQSINCRFIRLPHGPTMTFKVEEYVLAKDVVNAQKRPSTFQRQFLHSPLVVINNFRSAEKHEKLAQSMIQNMFPSINVNSVDLNEIRRCVIFNNNPDDGTIDFRHYSIKTVPLGLSKSTKKLVVKSKIPDLGKYKDISEFFNNPGQLSESEGEANDNEENKVKLEPGTLTTKGCKAVTQASVRLVELGPRLKLRLLKIESGIDDGEVLHHSYQSRTPEEVAALEKQIKRKRKLKLQRQKEQNENVRRKLEMKEKHKKRCLDGMGSMKATYREKEQAQELINERFGGDASANEPAEENAPEENGAAHQNDAAGPSTSSGGGRDPTKIRRRQPKFSVKTGANRAPVGGGSGEGGGFGQQQDRFGGERKRKFQEYSTGRPSFGGGGRGAFRGNAQGKFGGRGGGNNKFSAKRPR